MNGERAFSDWQGVLRHRAEMLHQQIAAMQRLVSESGGSDEMLGQSCAACYRLLDELYDRDMPIARALDRSDLLLHLDGEGLQTGRPRLSLVTGIMSDVRKQVGTMIKTLVSSINEAVELPREIDLGLSSFAQGSLYLGFSLPEPDPGYVVIEGDPLFAASRQALATLGAVTAHVNKPNAYELIQREFADPKLRDAALSAVGQLAPSGRRGGFDDRDWGPGVADGCVAVADAGDAAAGAGVAGAAGGEPGDAGVARAGAGGGPGFAAVRLAEGGGEFAGPALYLSGGDGCAGEAVAGRDGGGARAGGDVPGRGAVAAGGGRGGDGGRDFVLKRRRGIAKFHCEEGGLRAR